MSRRIGRGLAAPALVLALVLWPAPSQRAPEPTQAGATAPTAATTGPPAERSAAATGRATPRASAPVPKQRGAVTPLAATATAPELRALARSARRPTARRAAVRQRRHGLHAIASLRGSDALWLEGPVQSIAGWTHESYRIQKDGLPVFNATGRIHTRGAQLRQTGRLAIPPLARGPVTVDAEAALALARDAAPGRGERSVPRAQRGWHAHEGATVPAWRVTLTRALPLASWRITLDARNGAVLAREDLLKTVEGSGVVYTENVVTTPTPVAQSLHELDDSGFLRGRVTQVFDVRELEAFRPDAMFPFAEDDPRFVQTAVYRGLTDGARYAESLGLPPLTERVQSFTNLIGGPNDEQLNNAFYDPTFPIFGFGNGDGAITANLGTDYDVAVHEMGHHVFQQLVDPTGEVSLRSLASINEGFADTLAAFLTGDPEIGESTIPGQPFLRTVDNDALWPDDASLVPHTEGRIFSGLNWDLAQEFGIETAGEILIAALPFLDPEAIFHASAYYDALVAGVQAVSFWRRSRVERLAEARGLFATDDLGVEGFLEEGTPETRALADEEVHVWIFSEFPDSRRVRFQLTGGSGDADLVAGPLATFDISLPDTYLFSENIGPLEDVRFTTGTVPSVDDDDLWLVFVVDFGDGRPSTYTLETSTVLPVPVVAIGGSLVESIDEGGDLDLYTFEGRAGEIVRVEVEALAENMDLFASVFDPIGVEVFGADDDAGGGLDPLIQGAELPRTQLYGLAVFSIVADVDPRVGTGDYELRLSLCDNVGPNTDGDGLADVCDDDDDDDGFVDAFDTEPLDALRCQDIEGDTCDDCGGGAFDPFDDGANNDDDHLCDLGDPDDDNDGCADDDDPAPLTPSIDDDLDLTGEDCDNCPDDHNPGQLDSDMDGLGDACDPTPMPEPGAGASGAALLLALAALGRARDRGTRRTRTRGADGR